MATPTRNAEGFTPQQARQEIMKLERFADALEERAGGLTWMIWGLAGAGIFLSYGLAGYAIQGDFPVWAWFLFVPWVVGGVLTTRALWNAAALAAPSLARGFREAGWKVALAWIVVSGVAWAGMFLLRDRLVEPNYWLMAMGTIWILFGATNLYGASGHCRRVSIGIGVATIATAAILAVAAPGDYAAATIVGAAAGGGIPLLGGFYLTSRG